MYPWTHVYSLSSLLQEEVGDILLVQNMTGNTIIAFNKFDSNVNIQNIVRILNFIYALVLQGKHLERSDCEDRSPTLPLFPALPLFALRPVSVSSVYWLLRTHTGYSALAETHRQGLLDIEMRKTQTNTHRQNKHAHTHSHTYKHQQRSNKHKKEQANTYKSIHTHTQTSTLV